MTRLLLAAMASSLIIGQLPALAAPDSCTTAFLNEHLGAQDAAVMLCLRGMDSGSDATAGDQARRATAQFLGVRAEYQRRCPLDDSLLE